MDRLISPRSLVGSNGFNSGLGMEDMTFTMMYVKEKNDERDYFQRGK
jgi:hypothetical protein